jgi:integrative and conjugative element protein (TIGR02256 family)
MISEAHRLVIVEHAVAQMTLHAQRYWWQCEAGGALLGRHLLDSKDIVVDEVTTPQKGDRRSRFSFFRSQQHGEVARERWLEEQMSMAYLGLWHTHPESCPTPSNTDIRDWEKAIKADVFEGDRLFFPIVGHTLIRVWSLNRRGSFRELKEVTEHG